MSVDLYFVTNRNPNRRREPDDFGVEFSAAGVDDLRFGRATVGDPADPDSVEVSVTPERARGARTRQRLGSAEIFAELKQAMDGGADCIGFVHGYNVSFREALCAGARIARVYAARPHRVIVFSWPSDGSLSPFVAYKSDRTDARASGPALSRAILKLHEFLAQIRRGGECRGAVHLFAHSMGNYVLRNAVQDVRRQVQGALPAVFDQICLFAADEDHDAFEHEHKLARLPELGRGVNVYFNPGDTALVISDRTKTNPTRLGARGPRMPLNVPGNVTIVDAGEVVSGIVEHDYFSEEPRCVEDVLAVLRGEAQDRVDRRRYVVSQNRYVLLP